MTNKVNLEEELHADVVIKERVKDHAFAVALYGALCNVDWHKNGQDWGCSWRYAGGIVADLRDQGEDYIDFYCSGGEGSVSAAVEEELTRMGWSFTIL